MRPASSIFLGKIRRIDFQPLVWVTSGRRLGGLLPGLRLKLVFQGAHMGEYICRLRTAHADGGLQVGLIGA